MIKPESNLSDLVFEAQVVHEKASAAYVCLSNDLFEKNEPNQEEYRFRYDQHMIMNSICGDYLHTLGKMLEKMVDALNGKKA